MTPILAAEKITLCAGPRRLCADLDLHLCAGEMWVVLGVNGAGKTTLLHTLAGLRAPHAGTVQLDGAPLSAQHRRAVARRLGLLAQDSPDPFPATVLDTALLGRYPFLGRWERESAADRERARAALAAVELSGCDARSVATLSGGERRRLAFAVLLTQAPALWLLDEPTNHLDLRHQSLVLQQVSAACRNGGAAIMSLHDPNLAARYATHLLLLDGNGGWEAGPADELLNGARLSRLYGQRLREAVVDDRRVFVAE